MKSRSSQSVNTKHNISEDYSVAIGFRIFLLFFFIALLVIWFLVPISKTQVEQIYSQGIYATTANWLVPLLSRTGVSITGIVLTLFAFSVIFSFFFSLRRSKKNFTRRHKLKLWLLNVLVWLSFWSVLFVVMWGANYKRESIEQQLNLVEEPVTSEDVHLLAENLLQIISDSSNAEQNIDKALDAVRTSLIETISNIHSNVPTLPKKIKTLPKGTLLYLGNAAGIISPWFLEAHVDNALPPAEFVAVGAHEMAHIAGYAGEADADLLGVIAGLNADDNFTRYAVALRIFRTLVYQLTYQLPQEQQEIFADALPENWQDNLPEQALQDWQTAVNTYQRYSPPEDYLRIQQNIFDWYLRSQGVSEGIADYSRTVKLLVFAQRQGLIFGEADSEEIKIELNPVQ